MHNHQVRIIVALSCASIVACNATDIDFNNQVSDTNNISSATNSTLPDITEGLPDLLTTGGPGGETNASDGVDSTGGGGEDTSGDGSTGGKADSSGSNSTTGGGDSTTGGGDSTTTDAETSTGDTTGKDDTTGGDWGGDPPDENAVITDPPGDVYAVSLALGAASTYILLNTGEVKAWGLGLDGQLGYGNTANNNDPSKVGPINLGFKAKQIVTGHLFACALAREDQPEAGLARCWGFDAAGNLGRGKVDIKNPSIGDDEAPASAPLIALKAPIVRLAAGYKHACALLTTGEVSCWGLGSSGQLGYGDSKNVGDDELPISKGTVDVGGPVASIAAGGSQTCAILVNGTVRCWGALLSPQSGQWIMIGDDESPSSQAPLDFGFEVQQLTLGIDYLCALSRPKDGSRVKCIGTSTYAKLGYGNLQNQPDPLAAPDVPLPITPVWLDAMHVHSCAVSSEGESVCWGTGGDGALGYGSSESIGDDDTVMDWGTVITGMNVSRIYTGIGHTCALSTSADLNCWGSNYHYHGHPNYPENIGDNENPASAGLVKYL